MYYGLIRSLSIFSLIRYDTLVKLRQGHPVFVGVGVLGAALMVSSVISFTRGLLHDVTTERYPLWDQFHSLKYYFQPKSI